MEVRANPGSLVTSRSIYGALMHPSQLPRDTLLMPPRRSQKQLIILRPRDYSLPIVYWLENDLDEALPIMSTSASDITKKIYENARRSCARHTTAVAAVGGGPVRCSVGCGVA